MPKIELTFTEEELLSSSIYSRLEYLHLLINTSLSVSPLKYIFLDEASALINYSIEKKYYLPEHIVKHYYEDIEKYSTDKGGQ